jgi:ATP-binding cassette subfamily B protein
VGASDETAKEVKLFNLSGFVIDRFRLLSEKFYNSNKKIAVKRASWGTLFSFIGSLGYYTAYVVMILQTIEGAISIGTLTFLAGSFRQLRTLLESILSRFTSVSQGAIYLRDYFDFFDIQPKIKTWRRFIVFSKPRKIWLHIRKRWLSVSE